MKKSIVLSAFLLFLGFGSVLAQTYSADANTDIEQRVEEDIVQTNVELSQMQQSQGMNFSSSVFLEQVGNNNFVQFTTASTSGGTATILQNGDDNLFDVTLRADTFTINSLQNGDSNSVIGTSPFNVASSFNANIVQLGDDLNLTMEGGNSISSSINVRMEGQGTSVIVRNFN